MGVGHGQCPASGTAGHCQQGKANAAERKSGRRQQARTGQCRAQRQRDGRQRRPCSQTHGHQRGQAHSNPTRATGNCPAPQLRQIQQGRHAAAPQQYRRQRQLAQQGASDIEPSRLLRVGAEPLAQRAFAQLSPHGPGCRRHGQDMNQRWHQRRSQKLLVIGGDIEQRQQLRRDRLDPHLQDLVRRAALGRRLHLHAGRQSAHHLPQVALQQAPRDVPE